MPHLMFGKQINFKFKMDNFNDDVMELSILAT